MPAYWWFETAASATPATTSTCMATWSGGYGRLASELTACRSGEVSFRPHVTLCAQTFLVHQFGGAFLAVTLLTFAVDRLSVQGAALDEETGPSSSELDAVLPAHTPALSAGRTRATPNRIGFRLLKVMPATARWGGIRLHI